jgi:Flp pilus assembly protein CpaB
MMRAKVKRVDRGLTVARVLLLVAAVGLAGFLVYRQIDRMSGSKVPVWVTTADLRAGQAVTADALQLIQAAPPAGAIVNRTDIVGRTLAQPKLKGQAFYVRDFPVPQVPESLASTIPAGRVLGTLRIESMDMPGPQLREGDRLDIVQAGPGGASLVAHDAYVLGMLTPAAARTTAGDSGKVMGVDISIPNLDAPRMAGAALVLGLRPADVFPLARGEASGQKLKLVLHSNSEVEAGKLLDLRPPTAPRGRPQPVIEVHRGANTERVSVSGGGQRP